MQKQPFPVEGGSKKFEYWGGEKILGLEGDVTNLGRFFCWGGGAAVPHYIPSYFHLPNDPFHCAKFKKHSYSESRVMMMHHFWTQYGPFAPNKSFLENYYHPHLPIRPFHGPKSKKNSSSGSRVIRTCTFWTQNDPFPPN